MNIKKEILVDKPVEEVWDVLGNQFGDAYLWATGLYHSSGYGDPELTGATCSNRACNTNQGHIDEVLRKFDPQNHTLQYEVIKGFPFFVKSGINTWSLHKTMSETKVSIDFTLETKGLVGAIMNPMMKMQMNKIIENVLNDFKHYVETGTPSPSKAKENAKMARKAA